jgi:PII-like signaling protein
MKLEGEKTLLRVFLDKFQKLHHRPLYEAIVEMARTEHFAGATVLEGIEGFGQSGRILRDSGWNLSNNREVIIEIVDERAKLEDFISRLEPNLSDVIVTFERAHVIRHISNSKATP